MKITSRLMNTIARRFFLSSITCCLLLTGLSAQQLEQLVSSRLEVIDEKDHQIISCDTYQFGDEVLYDNPNRVRLYENGAYRFDFQFSYFEGNQVVKSDDYLEQFYSLQIPPSQRDNYRITAISPGNGRVSIYAIATGKSGSLDTFHIQLFDRQAELLADVIYPFEVREDKPGVNETAFLPMKMEYRPIYVSLQDVENPNNRIERQLLPFSPDTINVDAREAFAMMIEIEDQVQIGDESYVLVADYGKDYGYRAQLRWEGQRLREKPASKNGLRNYLTTLPSQNTRPNPKLDLSAIIAADLKKSGLNQAGSRVQQEFIFTDPTSRLKKVYQIDYVRRNPDVIRKRNDPQTSQYLINKYMPKVQDDLKQANQKILQYYQMKATPSKTLPNTTIPERNKTRIQTNPEAKPQGANSATAKTNVRVRDRRVMNDAVIRQNENLVITAPQDTPNKPKNNYYTVAIEISRETAVMSHQTYLLTFRLIE